MFVNIHGQPIDPSRLKPVKARTSGKATKSEFHKGFRAVGFSPAQLLKAKLEHERAIEAARVAGNEPPKPWDEESYMRAHRPGYIRAKPYELYDAAATACQLAAKEGWKRCEVITLASA